VHVADLEDGTRDFPQNADGRPTLTGMQPRVPSGGNIAASPTDGRLYITFTDNRLGSHDVDLPVTKARVFVTSSIGGATWSTPTPINDVTGTTSDQWFPWADVAPDGTLGVIYNQRTGTNTHAADLAQGAPAAFTTTRLTTADSDLNNSLYFQAGVPECRTCTTFHGDYLGLDYGSDGAANGAWTDMRDIDPETGLHRQFVYYARR